MNPLLLFVLPIVAAGVAFATIPKPDEVQDYTGQTIRQVLDSQQLADKARVYIGHEEAGLFGSSSYELMADYDYVIEKGDLIRIEITSEPLES